MANEISTTKTEVYLATSKITGLTASSLETLREFQEFVYLGEEDKTNSPTHKSFNFNMEGNLKISDSTHILLATLPIESQVIEYYPNGKTGGMGYSLPVYVENFNITGNAGEVVKFNATFRPAGGFELLS